MKPTLIPCGDRALMLQLGETIDSGMNARITALADEIRAAELPGVTEIVPTYRSLLLMYDPELIRGAALERELLDLWDRPARDGASGRLWRVPCLYGRAGDDLEELAAMKGMTPEEVVALHSGAEYRVYMIGFAPGFPYLGGLPEALHTPRLKKPRQNIPAGGVGIGGQQANINSLAGPSGWRYVGWTPIRCFDPERAEPFLFRAGDRIRFHPVDAAEAAALAERAERGDPLIAPESGDGGAT